MEKTEQPDNLLLKLQNAATFDECFNCFVEEGFDEPVEALHLASLYFQAEKTEKTEDDLEVQNARD